MNEFKYRKGDYVREDWQTESYTYLVIKDIPLKLWKDESILIGGEYVKPLNTELNFISNENDIITHDIKQYKVPYMSTALYKILHKGE